MKVFLDLTKLLKEGKITQAEYDKFSRLSADTTGSLAFNILIGFGIVAVVCALLALVPSPATAIFLGVVLSGIGISLLNLAKRWSLLAQMCVSIGALLLCGGILWLYEGALAAWMVVTALLLAGSIITRQGLLMVLAVLALSATVGASTSYYHAMYELVIEQPTITVVLFSVISYISYWLSKSLPPDYERLAIIASRTSIFLVNFGFWVGSLWSDRLPHNITIPDWLFAVVWAFALISVGVWSVKADRRWVLNVVAIFGAIHFYTQWFERLGATPMTVLIAGILALVFALFLKSANSFFNKRNTIRKKT